MSILLIKSVNVNSSAAIYNQNIQHIESKDRTCKLLTCFSVIMNISGSRIALL